MTDLPLSTEPYKGVRDFYPDEAAVRQYIFDTWAQVAASYGFERYDASVLEPADLYRSKTSEEIVNEQTYTFKDRGDREVTLRPEMTPTVARMVAARRRELVFPLRWYSIPNLFRYERPQKGRVREHWQLNCDIFGTDDVAADIEAIALLADILDAFGAVEGTYEIRVNNRALMRAWYRTLGIDSDEQFKALNRAIDRKNKLPADEFRALLAEHIDADALDEFIRMLEASSLEDFRQFDADNALFAAVGGLAQLGRRVRFDASLARGFDYYTGTIFEIFDTDPANPRSIAGGGRYDNLTALFGGDPIPAVGFGMGDVTTRDFLDTHHLLDMLPAEYRTAPTLVVIPTEAAHATAAQKLAAEFRTAGVRTATALGDRKLGDHIKNADRRGAAFVIVLGDDEAASGTYTLKELATGEETTGATADLIAKLPA